MKEAEASVFEEFLGPSEFANHGERVVVGQRLMQASSDIFLGWVHIDSRARRPGPRLLRPPAQATGRARRRSSRWSPRAWRCTAGCAAGRSRAPTPAAATGSRSPPTSATVRASTARSSSSHSAYAEQNERDYQRLTQGRGQVRADRGSRRSLTGRVRVPLVPRHDPYSRVRACRPTGVCAPVVRPACARLSSDRR